MSCIIVVWATMGILWMLQVKQFLEDPETPELGRIESAVLYGLVFVGWPILTLGAAIFIVCELWKGPS